MGWKVDRKPWFRQRVGLGLLDLPALKTKNPPPGWLWRWVSRMAR